MMKRGLGWRAWIIAATIAGLAAVAAGAWSLVHRDGRAGETTAAFQSMKMTRLASIRDLKIAALSRDGRFLAYVAAKDGKYGLRVRQVSTGSDVQILAPQEAPTLGLTFSPDGEYLYAQMRDPNNPIYNALYQVPTLGGTPRRILFDVDSAATFSPDGRQIAFIRGAPPPSATPGVALMIANADGTGERKLALKGWQNGFDLLVGPSWSPDGRRVAAMVFSSEGTGRTAIAQFNVADGQERRIGTKRWDSISALAWLPDGSGIALIGSEPGDSARQIWFVAYPDGKARRITNDLSQYIGISVSADARSLATVQVTAATDLWVASADDPAAAKQITFGEGNEYAPNMSFFAGYAPSGIAAAPSGSIVLQAVHGGSSRIEAITPDGTGRRTLTPDSVEARDPLVARGTGSIVYTAQGADRVNHVWTIDPEGGSPTQLTRGDGESAATVSPDGRWFIFRHDSSLVFWKAGLDGGAPTKVGPAGTGVMFPPQWSPDGRSVLFWTFRAAGVWRGGLEQVPAEGGPPLRWIDWPIRCDLMLPYRWAPSGDALTCIGELDGIYNLWVQPFAGGEPRPITRFRSGHIFDFDWSTDGKQLYLRRGELTTDIVLITSLK
jgi:Tol biopolymer transport system component